ncbi:MAG: dUTP diphosphatase [Victivallales bacterium]|jgi:dUTP pyrophosphatase|nr:dUTP diphosphatase [Victivallales bacterium]MBT7163767.1 dUTP diphosphatase [Victivallales bacterium]MBT7303598.1 dUTP diphosphatase [Victivallales bacterium]
MPVQIRFRMQEGDEELAPRRAHHDDAAFDIRANTPATVPPGQVRLIPTGLFLELPSGWEAQIRPRSGLALKKSITLLNSPGTIDAGYRGEVGIITFNAGTEPFEVERGDRIAQMVIQRLPEVELVRVEELSETKRGAGGFGSTGTE